MESLPDSKKIKHCKLNEKNLFSHPDEDIADNERVNCFRQNHNPLLFPFLKKLRVIALEK